MGETTPKDEVELSYLSTDIGDVSENYINKDNTLKVSFFITCQTILNNMSNLDSSKHFLIPENGIIYKNDNLEVFEGESVFDILLRITREEKIHMEYVDTPIYNSAYIEGINNIYEFDVGELSGWMYNVNGWFPNYGSSRYIVEDGDIIEWIYTCDLGNDIGGDTR